MTIIFLFFFFASFLTPYQLQGTHAMLVVGYSFDRPKGVVLGHWIVKNDRGDKWGENGYIRMSLGRNNNCGIATQASYPTSAYLKKK